MRRRMNRIAQQLPHVSDDLVVVIEDSRVGISETSDISIVRSKCTGHCLLITVRRVVGAKFSGVQVDGPVQTIELSERGRGPARLGETARAGSLCGKPNHRHEAASSDSHLLAACSERLTRIVPVLANEHHGVTSTSPKPSRTPPAPLDCRRPTGRLCKTFHPLPGGVEELALCTDPANHSGIALIR